MLTRLLDHLLGMKCPLCTGRHRDLARHQLDTHHNELAQWEALTIRCDRGKR